ncbi:MAG: pantothenate kinase [Pirellulaceae bacterium]|jgi:pantothenate kinase
MTTNRWLVPLIAVAGPPNFGESLKQCATVERLQGALQRASESLRGGAVPPDGQLVQKTEKGRKGFESTLGSLGRPSR